MTINELRAERDMPKLSDEDAGDMVGNPNWVQYKQIVAQNEGAWRPEERGQAQPGQEGVPGGPQEAAGASPWDQGGGEGEEPKEAEKGFRTLTRLVRGRERLRRLEMRL
jgi:hypothetical protein